IAHEQGKVVCFDFNFRPGLSEDRSYEWMKTQYERILPYCTILFGGKRELMGLFDDQEKSLEQHIQKLINNYNQIKYFSGSNRAINEGTEYLISLYDRIGTGDAFAAGVITGIIEKWSAEKTVDFATSNSVLAHTTFGDSPVMDKEI